MQKIRTVRFLKSAARPEQYPKHSLPEIAFIGRSNVGKSSLLNSLVRKKNLARISNTPGRTQLINFFAVEEQICFVDLPGYGFAKVPDHLKRQWRPMIESYLLHSETLVRVIFIVDARHAPTKHDLTMQAWLQAYKIPASIVATKIDKIPKTRRQTHIKHIRDQFHVRPPEEVIPFSALTGEGVKHVWRAVTQAVKAPDGFRERL